MKTNSAKATRWLGLAAGSALALSSSMAHAIAESESNDTFATANAGVISGTLTGAVGDASAPSNDADIWSFSLGAGQSFAASISYTGLYNPNDVNPVMTVFMEQGGSYYPVATTDPDAFGTSVGFTAWASGSYYLAITAEFNQGQDAFGNLATTPGFLSTADTLGTAFDSFRGESFTSFNYSVNMVPVPAAVWLFGSGLLGLIGAMRRRQ